MKKSILISAILTAVMSSSALAVNTITFNGLIKETTCDITTSAGAADFTVNFPIVSPEQFNDLGKIEMSHQAFKITASGESCESAKIYLSTGDMGSEEGLLDAKSVDAQTQDTVSIKVETAAGDAVLFNDYSGIAPTKSDAASKTSEYDFTAYYYADGTVPFPGQYTATATYIVTHL